MQAVIVNADDFGLNPTVNAAIIRCHVDGILTSTSLMVNEESLAEAVQSAKDHPTLDIGLHVAMSNGRAALSHTDAPGLVLPSGRFREDPALAGFACFFRADCRKMIRAEVDAQFRRFENTGLIPAHVDGHQHLHTHPLIWNVVAKNAAAAGFKWIRVPNEELRFHSPERKAMRAVEWAFFQALRRRCLRSAKQHGLRVADRVYGHLETGVVDEGYLLQLAARLDEGVVEIYSHPGGPCAQPAAGGAGDVETQALLSAKVRQAFEAKGIPLTTFRGLAP